MKIITDSKTRFKEIRIKKCYLRHKVFFFCFLLLDKRQYNLSLNLI